MRLLGGVGRGWPYLGQPLRDYSLFVIWDFESID
jgi:hypothetical protein